MKRVASFFILIVFFQITLTAQVNITGTIKDSLDIRVPFASVYLANTTIGTVADSTGSYKLNLSQKGVYELSVSCVGFRLNSKKINVQDKNLVVDFNLKPDNIVLNDIVVSLKDKSRKRNYAAFVKQFIGNTASDLDCEIVNPENIRLHFDKEKNSLTGYSVKPIEIENKALGYKIIYDLSSFEYDFRTQSVMYMGKPFFKEMNGTSGEKERWKNRRQEKYAGSKMNFARAIYAGSLEREGFEIFNFDSVSNTKTTIKADKMLVKELKLQTSPDYKIYYYPKSLSVSYGTNQEAGGISRILLTNPVKIYPNGYIENGFSIIWTGKMGNERVADMLPLNYDLQGN